MNPADHSNIQTIDFDLPCRSCRYNLRGQRTDGNCPECGAPVADAMISNRLCDADPAWLDALRRGAFWIVVGIFTTLGIGFFNMPLSLFFMPPTTMASPNQPPAPSFNFTPPPYPYWLTALFSAEGIAVGIIFIVGTLKLTSPEQNPLNPPTARATTRWNIVVAYSAGILASLIALLANQPALYASMALQLLSALCLSVGVPASLLYLRYLARRIPDPGLAKQTTIVFWGNIIAGGVLIAGLLVILVITLMAVNNNTSAQPLAMILGLSSLLLCPGFLAIAVFAIWWVVVMCLFAGALKRVYRDALDRRQAA